MPDAAIVFEKLNKHYGSHYTLREIDLSVSAGQTLLICGPSGSGQSTLIRSAKVLEGYGSGRLTVLALEVVDDTKQLDLVRKRVGMVLQSFNLFPNLAVLENCVLLHIRSIGRERAAATEEALRQLAAMRVEVHAQRYPGQIPGGQQQRTALARSLCLRPEIMRFDEPTPALDPEMITEVLEVMRELARGDMTILCVTHEMGFVRQVADEVILMANGQVVERGAPEQMFIAPREAINRDFFTAIGE